MGAHVVITEFVGSVLSNFELPILRQIKNNGVTVLGVKGNSNLESRICFQRYHPRFKHISLNSPALYAFKNSLTLSAWTKK